MFRHGSAKQADDFAEVKPRSGGNSFPLRFGIDDAEDCDHFVGELLTVRARI